MLRDFLPICLLILFFFVIFSFHTIYRHQTFNSHAFDLGIYTQSIFLYSQGRQPLSSLKHMNILGDHFGPILFLLSPIYRLFPYSETLLIIQALFVSFSGFFIYLIHLDKTKDKFQSLLFVSIYLSFSGILTAVNFDFHLATISIFPLSLMLYSWYFKSWKLYFFSLFFALLFKEDIPLFIIGLGFFSIMQRQKKNGLITVIIGFISYYLIKYQIMPKFSLGSENAYINTVAFHLNNPTKLLFDIFGSKIKITTLITLYGQFLFLPLLSILNWSTVFPYLVIRFLSNAPHYWGLQFHYNANLAPFLAFATILSLGKININKHLINSAFIIILALENLFLNRLVFNTLQFNINDSKKFSYINKSIKIIPNTASVSTQSPIVSHLSNRNKIYLYPEILDADYLVLDQSLDSYPLRKFELANNIILLENSTEWTLKQKTNSLLIFKRN